MDKKLLGVIASLLVALLLRSFAVQEQIRKANGHLRDLSEWARKAGERDRCDEEHDADGE